MAKKFMSAKLFLPWNEVPENKKKAKKSSVTFEGTARPFTRIGNQPDYVGEVEVNFKGEIVPVRIAIWSTPYGMKIIGK